MTEPKNPVSRAASRALNSFCLAAKRSENSVSHIDAQDRPDFNAEARIQAAVIDWIRLAAPGVLAFAIPNGGLRSRTEGARLKWTGVLAGVPDLALVASGGRVFFVECKTDRGVLSSDQRRIHDQLVALGTPCAIVRGIDDARLAFKAWGIETREAAR